MCPDQFEDLVHGPRQLDLVDALTRANLPADHAYEVLGALDAYATGFLMVWARTQASRSQQVASASPSLTDLRTLEIFERGLWVFIKGFEQEFTRSPADTSGSERTAAPRPRNS